MLSFDFKTGDVGNFSKQFKELTLAQQTAILTSNAFTDSQKEYLAKTAGLTLVTNSQAASTGNLSKTQVVATGTTTGLSTAFKGLWATMKPILIGLATNPLTWIVGATAAIAAIIHVANEFEEKTRESLEQNKTELEKVNSELETTKNRLVELNSKDSLSIVEQEELNRLKEYNNELQLRQKYLDKQVQDDQEKLYKKSAGDYNAYYQNQQTAPGETYEGSIVNYYAEQYQKVQNMKKNLLNDDDWSKKDKKDYDDIIQQIEVEEANLISIREDLQKKYDDFVNAGVTSGVDFDNIVADLATIDKLLLAPSENLVNFINSDEIESEKSLLMSLSESGQIVEESFAKSCPKIDSYLKENGLSFEDLISVLKLYNEELKNTENTTNNFSKEAMISELNKMSEGFEELDKIYESIRDKDPFDFKLLDDKNFKETFSGLDGYAEFFETITSNADDIDACQEAFNNLVSEWIDSTGILGNVTKENSKLTASMLEQMGVVNASQIVTDILEDQENATKFLESAEIDLVNATAQEINSLNILDGELAQSGGAIYDVYLKKKLTSENPIDTSADCNALIAMARQCQVTGENLALLIKLKNTYLTLESDMWGDATKQIAAKEAERLKAQLANTSFVADYKPAVSYKAPSTGKSSGSSSAAKDTKESFDWIERAVKKVQRTITNLGKTVSATYKSWTTRNSALTQQISSINSEISLQQKAYDYYMQKASQVGLSSSYIKKIQDGTINVETIKDESLINKIKEYQELYDKALTAKDAITDLNDEIASLAKSRFDNVATQFEEQISLIEHESSVLDALISQAEASGHVVSASFYESLIDVENKNLAVLKNEYTTLQNALNQAMAEGKIEKYSSDWYDMMNQINGVELAIIESNTALIEYQKNIRDLEWEAFDRMQEQISQITNESEFLIDLLSNEDLFNDDGSITKHGQATFGLHAVNYNTNLEQAKKYYEELSEIRKDLAKDKYDVDLLAREEELREAFQDTALAAKQEEQALIDLAEEGYNKMLDYMSELIDKQKELLNSQKDLFDYEKNVREQTEEIARLEKIAQAVANDDSEEGRLRAQQNAVALEEAREALQETEYDRYIQDQEKLYDQILDETEQWIDERLRNTDQLLADIVSAVNQNSASILETLKGETSDVGGALSEEMSSIWGEEANSVKKPENSISSVPNRLAEASQEIEKLKSAMTESDSDINSASNALAEMLQEIDRLKSAMTESDSGVVSTYTDGVSDSITNIIDVLGRIEDFVGEMDDESHQLLMKELENSINNSSNSISGTTQSSSNSNSDSTSSTSNASSSTTSSNWGSWFIGKKNSVPDNQLKIDSSIVDRLKYLDYDSSFSARAKYYAAMGLGSASSYTGSASQNKAMIDLMKKNGFHSGGYIGSLIKSSGEDGIAFVKKGEYILTSDQFEKLRQTMDYAQPFINAFDKMPRFDSTGLNNTITNNIDMNINMYEVSDVDGLVTELQHNKRFEKIIDAMGSGRMLGKNSYNKYKY